MATKKSFIKANPALSFISQESIDKVEQPETQPATTATKKPPEGYKYNPEFIEKKSRRVQSLIQPSLYNDAKAVSSELGLSFNDFLNKALHEATYNDYVQGLIKKDLF